MPGGRPSIYTQELAEEICRRIGEGELLRQVAMLDHMPCADTIRVWSIEKPEFSAMYARAIERRTEHYADEIVAISDDGENDWMERETERGGTIKVIDHEHIQRSKLRVDTRKWLMAKMLPRKYGDKQVEDDTVDGQKIIIRGGLPDA